MIPNADFTTGDTLSSDEDDAFAAAG